MKYFMDCEFLEGTQRERFPISLFRKHTSPTIDLISIGIVAEDNREYYAISKDFNLREAWNRFQLDPDLDEGGKKKVYWIRENVLKPIWIELFLNHEADYTFLKGKAYDAFKVQLDDGEHDDKFTFKSFQALINRYGKSNSQIASEIKEFCHFWNDLDSLLIQTTKKPVVIDFYAYYADYDWVAFCWLFGKMIDLPKGFPMYCKDLKQMLDDKAKNHIKGYCFGDTEKQVEDMAERSIKGQVESFKTFSGYPIQDPSKTHNAIEDARWNKELYEFINKL